MPFPATRLRRLRKTGVMRELVRETTLTPADLVYPMFVQLGEERTPVEAMPGIERMSIYKMIRRLGLDKEEENTNRAPTADEDSEEGETGHSR